MSDLINRQADCIVDILSSYTDLDIPCMREIAEDILSKLPSAPPQQKTSHWIAIIDKQDNAFTHPVFIVNGYACSECGGFNIHKDNFCPVCGADMRGEKNE